MGPYPGAQCLLHKFRYEAFTDSLNVSLPLIHLLLLLLLLRLQHLPVFRSNDLGQALLGSSSALALHFQYLNNMGLQNLKEKNKKEIKNFQLPVIILMQNVALRYAKIKPEVVL